MTKFFVSILLLVLSFVTICPVAGEKHNFYPKVYKSVSCIPHKEINLIEYGRTYYVSLIAIDSTLKEDNRYYITLNCEWNVGEKPKTTNWSGFVMCSYRPSDVSNGRESKRRARLYISQDESGITITERNSDRGFMWSESSLFSNIVLSFIQCVCHFNDYLCSDNYNGDSFKEKTEEGMRQRVTFDIIFEPVSWIPN